MGEPEKTPEAPEPSKVEAEANPQAESQVESLGEALRQSSKGTVGPKMLHWDIRYPGLYLAFITLNLLDLLITKTVIDHRGMDEANFLAKGFLLHFGFMGFVLYKLSLTGLVVLLAEVIARKRPVWAMGLIIFGCVAIGSVVVWGAAHLSGIMLPRGE